jgi:hypothetical protein
MRLGVNRCKPDAYDPGGDQSDTKHSQNDAAKNDRVLRIVAEPQLSRASGGGSSAMLYTGPVEIFGEFAVADLTFARRGAAVVPVYLFLHYSDSLCSRSGHAPCSI